MINLDISVVYQIVLFVVLWIILSKILFKPYLGLLDERERKTSGAQHDSIDLEHEGARLKAQYDEKIAQAQSAGRAAKEAILQDGRQQRETILAQAREQAATTLNQMRQQVAVALEQEKRLAIIEISLVAADMASKVLGRKVA